MSSILKALKKLEHEKSARKPDSFRIDAEILRGGATGRLFSTGVSLAAIALFLCGVGVTYVYMKHEKTTTKILPSQTLQNEIKGESSTGSTLLPVSSKPAAEPKPQPLVKEIAYTAEKTGSAPRYMEKHQVRRAQPGDTVPQVVLSEPKPVFLSAPIAPVVTPTPRHLLKVSGIAFQDGADSVAVINGITVSKGYVIEGARVEDIQKDHVKLHRDGETFIIILDKSN